METQAQPAFSDSIEPAHRATYALLIGALVAMLACCWLVDFHRILRRTPDDAYYFFKIAENVAQGHGATFDGIYPTSGFQPLWLLCLTPVPWLAPGLTDIDVRIGLSMQAAALFVGGLLIVSVLSRMFPWKVVFGVTICYTFAIFLICVNGMESAVEILALAAIFAYGYHARVFCTDRPSLFKEIVFGILLGVVMLARLDMVFLGAAVLAFRAWPALVKPQGRGRNLAGVAAIFTGAALVVAPYLAYNYATFGVFSPISGALKSNFPRILLAESLETLYVCLGLPKLLLLSAILACASLYLVWYFTAASRNAADARFYYYTSLAVLACAMVLHGLHEVLFMKWAVWTWHFFPYFLFAALAIAMPLERLLSLRLGRAVYWWAASALVVAGVLGYGLRMTVTGSVPTWQTASYEAANWARCSTDPAAVFALKDTGNFGFFSERKVINLDGVVNNLEYQDVLQSRSLGPYFRTNRVKYLVLHATRDEHPRVYDGAYNTELVKFRSNLYGGWSDPIPLDKKSEVYRSTYLHPQKDHFVIWDISSYTGAR